jgi:undecaprenyl-diphosphatase
MGFARVYVGAHYPQDVLAGYALGAAVSFAGYLLIRPALIRLIDVIARSPLYALVHPHRNARPDQLRRTS